jgi:hypothetical protein
LAVHWLSVTRAKLEGPLNGNQRPFFVGLLNQDAVKPGGVLARANKVIK